MTNIRTAWKRVNDFLLAPQSNDWLSVLRIGLSVQLLFYCLSMRADWNYILGGTWHGLISRQLSEFVLSGQSVFIPRLGWLVEIGSHFGVSEVAMLGAAWSCLLFAACLLLVGLFSRAVAILAWFLYLSSVKSGGLMAYGVDQMTTIGLFYLMISPLPDRFSLDQMLRKSSRTSSEFGGLLRRVLQIHLCIIYFFGGIAKCVGPGWWNGDSVWRALTHPPFNVISPEILVRWKDLFLILGISVWIIEITYPIFIWSRKTRPVWLLLVVGLHIGIGLTMGMYLFALIMIVLNLAAFGSAQKIVRAIATVVDRAEIGVNRLFRRPRTQLD